MEGERLGPYLVQGRLGSGGMGTVWRAVVEAPVAGLAPGTVVALKLLHPHLLETPGFFKRFLREAEIGRAVRHGNVVATYDADALAADGRTRHFLVMEYVEGQTLRELLAEVGRLPEELCRHLGRDVARGLAAIHAAGAVHRDLKPENVLVTPDHAVKVMDLGVARLADEAVRLSRTGHFVGSVAYAAPEQFAAEEEGIDARADLYSLGLTLFELVTGRQPYLGGDLLEVVARKMKEAPPSAARESPGVTPFFDELLRVLLSRRPADRPASAEEVARLLLEGEESEWWRKRARAHARGRGAGDRRLRVARETGLYGREAELGTLRRAVAAAARGEGSVVLLEGEAGIGKTRLLDELFAAVAPDGPVLMHGSWPPGGAATPAGAVAAALLCHFGDEELEDGLAACLGTAAPAAPGLAALLRGEPAPPGREPIGRDQLPGLLLRALRGLAGDRPLVLAAEDLHFAPEEGRALFASLALAVPGSRMLLVGTTRPGLPEAWQTEVDRMPGVRRLVLPRLGPKDMGELLVEALRSERLARELALPIGTKSDGNPFFALEIVGELRESGRLAEGEATTRTIRDLRIPSSVLELIRARIAELDEDEKELLDVAACAGFEFDPLLVAEAVGRPAIAVLRKLARVEARCRLVHSAGRAFRFDHHQVQEALHDGLPELLRESYHLALGEVLGRRPSPDPADLCRHLVAGGRPDLALPRLDAAVERLARAGRNEAAADLLGAVLAAPDLLDDRGRLRLLLARADRLDVLARRPEQSEVLEEALRIAAATGDARLLGSVRRAIGEFRIRTHRSAEALEILGEALADADRAADRSLRVRVVVDLALALTEMSRPEAIDRAEEAIRLAREIGDRKSLASAIGNLGIALTGQGRADRAQESHERHLAICREIGDRRGEAAAHGNLGVALSTRGRHAEAEEHFRAQLAIVRELGDRRGEASAVGNLGIAAFLLGRFDEAKGFLEDQLALCREIGNLRGEANATGNLGVLLQGQGDYPEALARFERHLEISRRLAQPVGEAVAAGNAGSVLSLLGRFDGARERLEHALAKAREAGYRRGEGYSLHDLGVLAARMGDADRAEALLRESLAVRREIAYPRGIATTLSVLGELLAGAGREADAEPLLVEALAVPRDSAPPGARARARAVLARLRRAKPTDALAVLAEEDASLDPVERVEIDHLLFTATGDRGRLEAAYRGLMRIRDRLPPADARVFLASLPAAGRILADWNDGAEEGTLPG